MKNNNIPNLNLVPGEIYDIYGSYFEDDKIRFIGYYSFTGYDIDFRPLFEYVEWSEETSIYRQRYCVPKIMTSFDAETNEIIVYLKEEYRGNTLDSIYLSGDEPRKPLYKLLPKSNIISFRNSRNKD